MTASAPTIAGGGRADAPVVAMDAGTSMPSNDGGVERRDGVQVEPDGLEHERREAGLVLVVERDAGDAPAPPLHVRHVTDGGDRRPPATACGDGLPGPRLRLPLGVGRLDEVGQVGHGSSS